MSHISGGGGGGGCQLLLCLQPPRQIRLLQELQTQSVTSSGCWATGFQG